MMTTVMYNTTPDSGAKVGDPFVTDRYLEDFHPGHTFASGRIRIDADRIKSFAAEFYCNANATIVPLYCVGVVSRGPTPLRSPVPPVATTTNCLPPRPSYVIGTAIA